MTAADAYREAIAIIAPAELAINAGLIARRAVEGHGIPDSDRMVVLREYAELLCALQRLQLSGAGLSDGGTGGGGDAPPNTTVGSPAPDANGASTPEQQQQQEEASGPARSGAEGHQPKDKPGAGLPPGTTTPPGEAAATPPGRRPPGGPDGMAGSGAKGARRDERRTRGSAQSEPGESHGSAAGQPTPGSSPVTLWAFKRGAKLSRVLRFLRDNHGKEFPTVSSTTDLYQLEGEPADLAVRYLDAGFSDWSFP